MQSKIYPMTFMPVLKDYLWGGRNLESKLGRILPDGIVAESWEIAGHEDGTSVVENGLHKGKLLTEVHSELGIDLIGSRSEWAQNRSKFPLLIKVLDANKALSVQVHPDDEYALENEGNELGKTEMWVILHAEPNAKVILGVKKETSPAAFEQAISNGDLEKYLHEISVKTGDHICVPAGSLHAIMDGLVIAEIQQNSNTTYRVYDWNRVDADGKPRALHVKQALEVTNFDQIEPKLSAPKIIENVPGLKRSLLCKNKYFTVERVELSQGSEFTGACTGETFEIWGVIDGTAEIVCTEILRMSAVKFALLPAVLGDFKIKAASDTVLLRAYVE